MRSPTGDQAGAFASFAGAVVPSSCRLTRCPVVKIRSAVPSEFIIPISGWALPAESRTTAMNAICFPSGDQVGHRRSEEHTSELQSHSDLVCRLLLEKKNK